MRTPWVTPPALPLIGVAVRPPLLGPGRSSQAVGFSASVPARPFLLRRISPAAGAGAGSDKGGALLPPLSPLGILVNVRLERRGLSAAEQATPETWPRCLCRGLLVVGQQGCELPALGGFLVQSAA